MKKLLAQVLSLALIFNSVVPAFAQTPKAKAKTSASKVDLSNVKIQTEPGVSDPHLRAQIEEAMKNSKDLEQQATVLTKQLEEALNNEDWQEAEQIRQELEKLVLQQTLNYESINRNYRQQAVKDYSEAMASGPGVGGQDPLSVMYQEQEANDRTLATYASLPSVITPQEFNKRQENKKIEFKDLIDYISPLDLDVIHSADPIVVASAADMLGGTVEAVAATKDPTLIKGFTDNALAWDPNNPNKPNTYRTNLIYIQQILLESIGKLANKQLLTPGEELAKDSMRVALWKILNFYFQNKIPNPILFEEDETVASASKKPATVSELTQENKDKSQRALMNNMYQALVKELKAFANDKDLDQTKVPFVNATYASQYAVIYVYLHDKTKLFDLFKIFDQADKNDKFMHRFSAITQAMLVNASQMITNQQSLDDAVKFLHQLVATSEDSLYTGHTFSVSLRVNALEAASLIYQNLDAKKMTPKLAEHKQYFAYYAAQIYCPLVDGKTSKYGLQSRGMEELADNLARLFQEFYVPGKFPEGHITCDIFPKGGNFNTYVAAVEIEKKQVRILGEGFLWIYGGEIFGLIARGSRFLIGATVSLPKAIQTTVKGARLGREAEVTLLAGSYRTGKNGTQIVKVATEGERILGAGGGAVKGLTVTGETARFGEGAAELGSMATGTGAGTATGATAGAANAALSTEKVSRLRLFVETLRDGGNGFNLIKGPLNRNAAKLIYQTADKEGKLVQIEIRSNKIWRQVRNQPGQLLIRQERLGQEATIFAVDYMPSNIVEMGRMWQALKGLREGEVPLFNLYNIATRDALMENARLQQQVANAIEEDGGVDLFVPLKNGTYWNTRFPNPPAEVVGEQTSTVYLLPRGAAASATEKELLKQGAAAIEHGALQDAAVDALMAEISEQALAGELKNITVEHLAQGMPLHEKLALKAQARAASKAAVKPQLLFPRPVLPQRGITNYFINFFKSSVEFLGKGLPQAKIAPAFSARIAPKWAPAAKPFYTQLARFGKSHYMKNVIAFEILESFDMIQYLQTVFSNQIQSYAQEDVEEALKLYPALQKYLDEQKEEDAKKKDSEKTPAPIMQSVAANNKEVISSGVAFAIPLLALYRGVSNTANWAGIDGVKWLNFNLVNDAQRAQFAVQNGQLFTRPIVEDYMQEVSINTTKMALDNQRDALLATDNIRALIAVVPSLKSDITKTYATHKEKMAQILRDKNSTPEQKNEQLTAAQKRFSSALNEVQLNAEETSYLTRADIKDNKELSGKIRKIFQDYRQVEKRILDNDNLKEEAKQAPLTEARTKMYRDLNAAIMDTQEKAYINSPDVQNLIKAVPAVEDQIHLAYSQYRVQERQINDNKKLSPEAKAKKLVEAQQTLADRVTNVIQEGNILLYKSDQSIKDFIELDPTLEPQIDKAFRDYFAKVNAIEKDTRLSLVQKQKQAEQEGEKFSHVLDNILLDAQDNLTLKGWDIRMLSTVYPEMEKEVKAILSQYREKVSKDESLKTNEEALQQLLQEREEGLGQVVQKYSDKAGSNLNFWKQLREKLDENSWAELAAFRQQTNYLILATYAPKLLEDASMLSAVNEQLEMFMNTQIAMYTAPGTDLDASMATLIRSEEGYKWSILNIYAPELRESLGTY